jgi:hypothetical protein
LIQGKYFLTSVKTLVSSLKALEVGDCSAIGALENIKVSLIEIKGVIYHPFY